MIEQMGYDEASGEAWWRIGYDLLLRSGRRLIGDRSGGKGGRLRA
jgi:hypothetical protein